MANNVGQSTPMQQVPTPEASDGTNDASLPLELQGAIGQKLKVVYGQMLLEPLPAKFAELLAQLGKADKN